MKWLTHHIFDLITKFRGQVYLENLSDPGADTDKFLIADTDGKIGYRTGAGVLSDTGALSSTSDTISLTSASSNLPSITLTNSNEDDTPSSFSFVKTANSIVGDKIGVINFTADNAAGEPTSFASIAGNVRYPADTDEVGILKFNVATGDGSTSALQSGISLEGTYDDTGIDVTIGYGNTSITTVAGTLTMGSTAFVNNSGVIQVATQGTIDHDSLANFVAAEHYRWDTDISGTATINAANIPTLNQNTTGSSASCTGNAATATALASGDQTIDGDLTVTGNDIKDDDGTTCITFDSSGETSIAKKLTVGSSQNEVLELNTTSAAGSPFISFKQNGSRKSFIQHNDTSDTLKIASEFGAISLLTDSGGSETERLGINSNGNATFTGGLTVDGVLKSATRRFSVTSDTDGTHDGDVVFIGGTTSMTTGAIYHYKSDGTWELADATDNTKSDGLLGVALGAASDTNGVLLRGMVTLDHDPGAVGDVVYLKTTAGDSSSTAPSSNGNIVRVIGYCLNASNGQIWFNPDSTFVEITA